MCAKGEDGMEILSKAVVLEDGENYFDSDEIPEDTNTSRVFLNAPEKESEITGWVNSEEDGYLVFKIPFENGWKIYVDGQKQEIEKADL